MRQSQSRIPELDGLRGFAILIVFIFHYVTQEGAVPAGSFAAYLQRIMVMGGTGVDLFFVLSGFLIGGILMDARESPSFFRVFYARRFFRIIPIYYLWTTFYIALVAAGGSFLKAHAHSGLTPQLGWRIYIHYLFLQNFFVLSLVGLAGAWFGPTWSLAIEEQFYLIAPAIVRFVSPKRLSTVLVSTIVVIPLLRIAMLHFGHPSPVLIPNLMITRADTLALGILAALFWRESNFRKWAAEHTAQMYLVLGVLMLGFGAFWLWSPQTQTRGMESIGYSCVGLTYTVVLLLALSHAQGPIAVVTRMGWLRELGRISYCVYIIHVAVNVICHAMLLHSTPRISTPAGFAVSLLAALLTIALAEASWLFIEGPLLRLGHSFKYAQRPADVPLDTSREVTA